MMSWVVDVEVVSDEVRERRSIRKKKKEVEEHLEEYHYLYIDLTDEQRTSTTAAIEQP